ncbi:MAG: hypothetical protein JXR86_10460 [Spirochaetales bacterium]|nr:hypothetical protein [Spirochaetales bacterium]
MVSTIWFIALPLGLAFILPFRGLGHTKRDLTIIPLVLTIVLGGLLFLFRLAVTSPVLEGFVLDPPLGISFRMGATEFLFLMIVIGSAFLIALNIYGEKNDIFKGYQFPLIFSLFLTGAIGIILTGDLFNLFIFWEILSIAAYLLTTLEGKSRSFEGGIKYLLTGALSSVFILIAVSLIYYSAGTMDMVELGRLIPALPSGFKALIFLCLFIGFAIEAEIFPLNLWAPDVFEASESRAGGLFSSIAVKTAAFALLRLFFVLFGGAEIAGYSFFTVLLVLALATLIIAEFAAFHQSNLKRMLGYSSIGQVALALTALSLATESALTAGLFHLLNHSLIKVLLFSLAAFFIRKAGSESIADFKGMGRKFPVAGLFFTIGALAVAGFPPFSPFASKMAILKALMDGGHFIVLTGILVATVVEVGYYFKVIQVLYAPVEKTEKEKIKPMVLFSWFVPAALLTGLGIYPSVIMKYISLAAGALF